MFKSTFARRIRHAVQAELEAAAAAEALGRLSSAFHHLERAHVLGQAATGEHVRIHWRMLGFAFRHRLVREVVGQLWRLIAASIFGAFGLVPEGNTGGSDVSGFRRMSISAELKEIIATAARRA
jgi:hypothetical protein